MSCLLSELVPRNRSFTAKRRGQNLSQQVDRVNFTIAITVLLLLSVPLLLFPDQSAASLKLVYAWIADTFGWFYILTGAASLVTVLYVGFSRFGSIRLGHTEPEFSTKSWVAMLFAAGIGSGMMYWSGIEWAHYIQAPPFRAEPFSHCLLYTSDAADE